MSPDRPHSSERASQDSSRAETHARAGRTRDERRRRLRAEIPLILWLLLVWIVLWRDVSPMIVLSGLVLSAGLTRWLELPPVHFSHRFNLYYALVFVVRFLVELTQASLEVLWVSLKDGPRTRSAIVAAPLCTTNDVILSTVANTITLIPGSVAVEVDRTDATLYFHTLLIRGESDIEKMRASVCEVEARLIRAMGTADELAELRRRS